MVYTRSNITIPKEDYFYVGGCSFTYGTGLPPDRWGPVLSITSRPEVDFPQVDKDESEERKNWAYHLSDKLELPYVNSSFPGLGTDEIIRSVYELILTKDKEVLPSIIIIQLSSPLRIRAFDDDSGCWGYHILWQDHEKHPKIKRRPFYSPRIKKNEGTSWNELALELYSDYSSLYNLITSLLLIKNKCDSLGIKFIVFDGLYQYNDILTKQLSSYEYQETEKNEVLLNYLIDSNQNKTILYELHKKLIDENCFIDKGKQSWRDIIGDFDDGISNEMKFVCGHPTELAHKIMSKKIHDFIKNDYH